MRIDLTRRSHSTEPIDLSAITLRLSRRNIEALLHMLDAKDKAVPALSGRDQHVEILVMPEENEQHYSEHPAGAMSWER